MKKYIHIMLFLLPALYLQAQMPEVALGCEDVVYVKGGTIWRGAIVEYRQGDQLTIRTNGNLLIQIPESRIKRIRQQCKGQDATLIRTPRPQRAYSFKEKGLYHSTRFSALPGKPNAASSVIGGSLQHSSGYKWNRFFATGLGAGVESLSPGFNDVVTYPFFVEIRGFLQPKHVSFFYAVAGGHAWTGPANTSNIWGTNDSWRGGWMAQGQIGYRVGNNLTIHTGLRFQKKIRDWNYTWQPETRGTDRYLQQRMEIGIGLLL